MDGDPAVAAAVGDGVIGKKSGPQRPEERATAAKRNLKNVDKSEPTAGKKSGPTAGKKSGPTAGKTPPTTAAVFHLALSSLANTVATRA